MVQRDRGPGPVGPVRTEIIRNDPALRSCPCLPRSNDSSTMNWRKRWPCRRARPGRPPMPLRDRTRRRPRRPSACSASSWRKCSSSRRDASAKRLCHGPSARVGRGSDEARHDRAASRAARAGPVDEATHSTDIPRSQALRRADRRRGRNGSCANCRPSPRRWRAAPRLGPLQPAAPEKRFALALLEAVDALPAAGARPVACAAQHVGGAGGIAAPGIRGRLHAAREVQGVQPSLYRTAVPAPVEREASLPTCSAGRTGGAERSAAEPSARVARPTVQAIVLVGPDAPGAAC